MADYLIAVAIFSIACLGMGAAMGLSGNLSSTGRLDVKNRSMTDANLYAEMILEQKINLSKTTSLDIGLSAYTTVLQPFQVPDFAYVYTTNVVQVTPGLKQVTVNLYYKVAGSTVPDTTKPNGGLLVQMSTMVQNI
jgi:hypothetical protein